LGQGNSYIYTLFYFVTVVRVLKWILLCLQGSSFSVYKGVLSRFVHEWNVRVFYIEYTLAPDLSFPGSVDQSVCAYKHLTETLGFSCKSIVFGGDSAGGGMALLTMQKLQVQHLNNPNLPAGAFLLSLWTDTSCTDSESLWTQDAFDPWKSHMMMNVRQAYFLQGEKAIYHPKSPAISPLFGNFAGLPPLYLVAGQNEVLLSDTTRTAAHARAEGVKVRVDIVQQMFHVFALFDFPEAKSTRKDILVFIQEVIGRPNKG